MIWIMFLHWIADFVCQSDAMAVRKSSSPKWLLLHVAVYTAVMAFTCIFSPINALSTIAYIFGTHLVVDFFTSKMAAELWKCGERHHFFVIIGFDQFLHFVTLFWWFA